MRRFFHCWLSNEDHQVWLHSEIKLWGDNKNTLFPLAVSQSTKCIGRGNIHLLETFRTLSFGEVWMMLSQFLYPPISASAPEL